MGVELRIDRIRCDGAGLCAELLPELVTLDDWGFPIVQPGEIPPELLEHARRAVDVCPVLAIRLSPPRASARPVRHPGATAQGRATARWRVAARE